MRPILNFAFLFFLLFHLSPQVFSNEITIHVDARSETGGDGSREKPFRSLAESRDRIRALRQADQTAVSRPVTVLVAPGLYARETTLEFEARDGGTEAAPVIYRSTEPKGAKIIGGLLLPADRFRKVDDAAVLDRLPAKSRDKILVCDLEPLGVQKPDPLLTAFRGAPTGPWLYLDRKPMTLARWPNAGLPDDESWAKITTIVDDGLPKEDGPEEMKKRRGGVFVFEDERSRRWKIDQGVWMHGYWCHDWADEVIRVESYDPETKTFKMAAPHHYGISLKTWGKAYRRFYALNLLEELDAPGEWWIDRENRKLFFYPPGPLTAESVIALATLSKPLVSGRDVKHMKWIGFSFEYGHDYAMTWRDAENIGIYGCEIANFGRDGISLSGKNGEIRSCDMFHFGRGGIVLDGGDRKTLTPANNLVENCHIHHYGMFQRTISQAVLVQGCGQIVRNNRFHDAPHKGVMYGGNEHLFERNEIYRILLETGDAGTFYSGRDWTTQGNVIKHNLVYHLGGGDARYVNTMGVYLDDCDCGDRVEGNIFYRAGRAIMIGGGRDHDILNNLVIACPVGLHIDSRGMTWPQWNVKGGGWNLEEKAKALDYKGPLWSARYPRLARIMDEEPQAPLGNVIRRNVFIDCKKFEAFDANAKKLLPRLDIADNLVVNTTGSKEIQAAGEYSGFKDVTGTEKTSFAESRPLTPDGIFELYDNVRQYLKECPLFEDIPLEKIGLYVDEYRSELPFR